MNPHPNDPKKINGDAKTPLHLLPPYALAQTALAHREGAERYGEWNWRQTGVCATTYIGAIMRHLAAWQDGEDLDPDSGLSHIAKIAACCNILLDAEHCGKLVDDRSKVQPKTLKDFIEEEQRRFIRECKDAGAVLRMYQSHTPEQNLVKAIKESIGRMANERIANSWAAKLALELPDPKGVFVEVAMPEGLPPLPPVPEGFDRWEYRGMGWESGRVSRIAYVGRFGKWLVENAKADGGPELHYIEAVKDTPPDTSAPLPPERFDTSQLIPPPPPLSKLPVGFTKWEYRGKEWTCNRRKDPPYFCNIGLADPLTPPTSAEDVKWTSYSYQRDWPEGMGWYYEAVK
jgi:hypothetical protein